MTRRQPCAQDEARLVSGAVRQRNARRSDWVLLSMTYGHRTDRHRYRRHHGVWWPGNENLNETRRQAGRVLQNDASATAPEEVTMRRDGYTFKITLPPAPDHHTLAHAPLFVAH